MKNNLENLFKKTASGIKPGLKTTENLLECLGNPHTQFKAIHIAGTNGKGSTAAYLESIFRASDLNTGLYTSPHLFDFNERIKINGQKIKNEELKRLFKIVETKDTGQRKATFFEFTTAMAFLHFLEKNIDIAIIETGMGGRFDSTNVITPILSIITNIGIEHTDFLGDSIEKIAYEKAGIIKKNIPIITGANGTALDIIKKTAVKNNSDLFVAEKDFSYFKKDMEYSYRGIAGQLIKLAPSLNGRHQLINASVALAACEVINMSSQLQAKIQPEKMKKAISETRWDGRLQTISSSPNIIVDCAHNTHAAKTLAEYITSQNKSRTIVIFGCLKDKNPESIIKTLQPVSDMFIFTKPASERAIDPEELPALSIKKNIVIEDPFEALAYAKKIADPKALICIAGSIYLVGKILENFDKMPMMRKPNITNSQNY